MKKKLLSWLALTVFISSMNYSSYALNPFTRFKNWLHGYSTVEKSARKVASVDFDKVVKYAKKSLKEYYDMPCSKRDRVKSPKVSDTATVIPGAVFGTMYQLMGRIQCVWFPSYVKGFSKNVFVGFGFPECTMDSILLVTEMGLTDFAHKCFDAKVFDTATDDSKHGYARFKALHEKLLNEVNSDDSKLTRPVARFMNGCELLKLLEQELKKADASKLLSKKYMILVIEDRSQNPDGLAKFHVELMERRYSTLLK